MPARAGIALVLFAVGSYAYADTNSIAGRVVDPQEASVAGAKVNLTNAGGVKIAETVSDAAGAFRFCDVEPGVYSVAVFVQRDSHRHDVVRVIAQGHVIEFDEALDGCACAR